MTRQEMLDFIRKMLRLPHSDRPSITSPGVPETQGAACGSVLLQDTVTGVTGSPPSPSAIGKQGIALIREFEGCARRTGGGLVEAYPDPGTGGEPWTIGWGATGNDHVHGGRIGKGTVWTQPQCDARLEADLRRYAGDVARAIGEAPTTQGQFDALVSFHYNTGAIGKATLTRKHIAGDHAGAAREFDRWVHAGGRVMRGLKRRRAAEAALYRASSR